MIDELKILSLINDQNTPNKVVEHLFAGEFEAQFDSVTINYNDSNGFNRSLTYDNVVIKTELTTELIASTGTFTTSMRIVMWSDSNNVLDHRLHRPEYVQQFIYIAKAMYKKFEDVRKNKNIQLWNIVSKF